MNAEEIADRCAGADVPGDVRQLAGLVGELAREVTRLRKRVDDLSRWKDEQTAQGNGNGG